MYIKPQHNVISLVSQQKKKMSFHLNGLCKWVTLKYSWNTENCASSSYIYGGVYLLNSWWFHHECERKKHHFFVL